MGFTGEEVDAIMIGIAIGTVILIWMFWPRKKK